MTTSGFNDTQRRTAHVEQEKSTDEIFEHVIRGVRLNRLRELLRSRHEQHTDKEERNAWLTVPEPETA